MLKCDATSECTACAQQRAWPLPLPPAVGRLTSAAAILHYLVQEGSQLGQGGQEPLFFGSRLLQAAHIVQWESARDHSACSLSNLSIVAHPVLIAPTIALASPWPSC